MRPGSANGHNALAAHCRPPSRHCSAIERSARIDVAGKGPLAAFAQCPDRPPDTPCQVNPAKLVASALRRRLPCEINGNGVVARGGVGEIRTLFRLHVDGIAGTRTTRYCK